MYKPVFLIYLNRSGSTFLAKYLDQFTEIAVTPEAHLKDNIYKSGYRLNNRSDLNKYLNYFYRFDKNKSWKIPKEKLIYSIEQNTYPIPFNVFLSTLWKLYFNAIPQIIIYKSPYTFFIKKIKKLFPDAKFIFIIRDLRGIYRSQKTTPETIRKISMAETPIETAYKFNKAQKIIRKYEQENWFYWLKYENFIQNSDLELNKILHFLQIPNATRQEKTHYSEKLANSQKKIHPNLDKNPIIERIDAWKKELSPAELYIISKIAGKAMKNLNYTNSKIQLNPKDLLEIIKIALKYLFSVHGKIDIFRIFLRGDV